MKLHNPEFQRQLRHDIKAAVRASPSLKKQYRRARKFNRYIQSHWALGALLSVGFSLVVFRLIAATHNPATALATMALCASGWLIFQSEFLGATLHTHKDIFVLRWLPVADDTIFRWQLQRYVKRASMSLFAITAAFCSLAWHYSFSSVQWLAVPLLAILTWFVMLASTALYLLHVPQRIRRWVISILSVTLFFSMFLLQFIAVPLMMFLDRHASVVLAVVPVGWPMALFQILLPHADWSVLILLLPTCLVIWTIEHSLNRLRQNFVFVEPLLPVAPDLLPPTDTEHSSSGARANPSDQRVGVTEIEELILSRKFLAFIPWEKRGRFERWLWHWLTPREKTLSGFAFPRGFTITAAWLKLARNICVALVAGYAASRISPVMAIWVFGAGLLFTGPHACGQFLFTGIAFRQVAVGGIRIPMHAGLGIGYGELARFQLKCCVVQFPPFLLAAMAWCVAVARLKDYSWQFGLVFGFKVAVLMIAMRLLFTTIGFSSATNDSTGLRLGKIIFIVTFLGLGLAFIGLALAGLLAPQQPIAWLLWLLALLDAWLLFSIYGWNYNHNRFDLMSIPPANRR